MKTQDTQNGESNTLLELAGMPSGIIAASPLYTRIFYSPWWLALGWAAAALLTVGVASIVWSALLSVWYKRSLRSEKSKQVIVCMLSFAIPLGIFVLHRIVLSAIEGMTPWWRYLKTIGVWIGGSLAVGALIWGEWRFVLWIERKAKQKG